ncbi:iron-siderophore ABC transporter substrate-binding protein [Blastopirellula sp. JC732]|uniref:Iron-siderophore ABC transporter substrate-binding protein n=1 Tax=Blastopirellula sediminis TaxID=2894196 RepID=A0A9X1SLB4_9BACT|nr:iron-siderophore ABC transporter substrate-binding protein [Blastopirellula sediminis]MCC9606193.1 iron-siderophore ABC transporter substrate-binding protein [Blastopirellula sediminis]MCC9630509.1 iron-siderophore ABC transporter substrate-binding protein [Blastopirellula sediminis]
MECGCDASTHSPSPLTTGKGSQNQQMEAPRPGAASKPIVVTRADERHVRVEHLLGATVVPMTPRRVCALAFTDELLAIGVQPLAASCSATGFSDYLRPQLDGVVPIYQMMGAMFPDLEAIVRLQPDLILTANPDPQTYSQLSKIAPVVVLHRSDWDDRVRILDVGRLLGKEAEAAAVLAGYDAKVAAAKTALQQKVGDQPVSFFRVFGRQMYIHGHTRGGLLLYDELGLQPPKIIEESPRGYMLSPESLLQLDSQHLFVAAEDNLGAQRSWDRLLEHPAWKRVPAVQQGNVYPIHEQHQWLTPGIQGRSRMIDEIVGALAPESLESVQQAERSAYEASRS